MIPLHPRIVHFPVALLISATLFGILTLLVKSKRQAFKEVMFWNLVLGLIAAVAAIITGLISESTLVHNEVIHEIMETHETIGVTITIIFAVVLGWFIFRKKKMQIRELSAIVVIMILTAGLLGYGAHLGGKMVYEEGAAVVPMIPILEKEPHHHHEGEEAKDLDGHIHHDIAKDSSVINQTSSGNNSE